MPVAVPPDGPASRDVPDKPLSRLGPGPNYPGEERRATRGEPMTTLLSPEITTVGSLTERCDRCGAAARLTVTLATGGDLAFCGHHGNKHAAELGRLAVRVRVEDGFRWAGGVAAA
jgi:hypothetical protein